MILPDPVDFITACQYEEVTLEMALGDELFLALHMIMKGCKDYMKHLKYYHTQQEYALGMRTLLQLSELRMCKLDSYDQVPSPEEIRCIVARCVTVSSGYCNFFLQEANKTYREQEVVTIIHERDNSNVMERIARLREICHGPELGRMLREILEMPASAVGVCHSFHYNEFVMEVAMRQFGIGLLVVRDDNGSSDFWPYETINYLDRVGSRWFLPLTFGLIHIEVDGNVSILRKRRPTNAAK
jgi:hypothetical protein